MGFGKKVGSIATLKRSLQKSSSAGNVAWIKYIPKDGDLMVRFLQEPDEWVEYDEAWDDGARKSFPVPEHFVLPDHVRSPTTRYLCNALDVDSDRVIPLQLPRSLMNDLIIKYEKYGTLMDRDYELSRRGAGKDTRYTMAPEPQSNRKLDKYDLLDLTKVLTDAFASVFPDEAVAMDGDADGDDSSQPTEPVPTGMMRRRTHLLSEIEEADILPDDDDDVDDATTDDDDDATLSIEVLREMPIGALRAMAKEAGTDPKGMTKTQLVNILSGGDPDEEPL